jgi:DNA-binding response OmpR family regulator
MKILIADDDQDLLQLLSFSLSHAGFDTVLSEDGTTALQRFGETNPDLVILDVNMPGASGFDVCQAIRERSLVPIMMLTARTQEDDVVHALALGADDYVTKPFSPRALIARVRALSRRASTTVAQTLRAGHLELDCNDNRLTLSDTATVALTALEARLLEVLMTSSGRTVSADRLLRQVWGRTGIKERHALKQLVHRLRAKLRAHEANDDLLQTSPGVGYRLALEVSEG